MPVLVNTATFIAFPAFLGVNVFLASRGSAFQAMLTELVGSGERGSLMSLTTAAGQVGFASGAAVAGPTFVTHGFMGNALLAAAASALVAVVVWFFIPDRSPERRQEEGTAPIPAPTQPCLCGPGPECGDAGD